MRLTITSTTSGVLSLLSATLRNRGDTKDVYVSNEAFSGEKGATDYLIWREIEDAKLGGRLTYTVSSKITAAELDIHTVPVDVAAMATSGSSGPNTALAGGMILGSYPAGNQDQHIDNIVLGTDGSITVTLHAAASVANTFKIVVLSAPSL